MRHTVVKKSSIRTLATQSILTLISRALGLVRELLFVRIAGTRLVADAFLTALRIPNTLYELCIGGACAPALLPTMTGILRSQGIAGLSSCLTGLIIMVGSCMLLLAYSISNHAPTLIRLLAPGFAQEQVLYAATLLPPMTLFMVTSALTACIGEALRTLRSITIPAAGQSIVNGVFICGLCWYGFYWPITTEMSLKWLAGALVAGGVCQLIAHCIAAWQKGLRPRLPYQSSWHAITHILKRMLPAMLTTGIQEISILIEQQFASYLPIGSIALLFYASSFVRLPFGIFAHALVATTLPDLAHMEHYAPRRVDLLLADMIICIGWCMIPMSALLACFAEDIFNAIAWWSPTFPHTAIAIAATLLRIKALSLLFLGINHSLLQLLYLRHQTFAPTVIAGISIGVQLLGNYSWYPTHGIYGIAWASTATTCIRTLLFGIIAYMYSSIHRSTGHILNNYLRIAIQTACCIGIPYSISYYSKGVLANIGADQWLHGLFLWSWLAPLIGSGISMLYLSRNWFGIRIRAIKD